MGVDGPGATAVAVVVVSVAGATVDDVGGVRSAFVVEVSAVAVVLAPSTPANSVVSVELLAGTDAVLGDTSASLFSRSARVFAGAGLTSSLSTTATPAQATPTATMHPRSQSVMYATGLITSPVCGLQDVFLIKPTLKES